MTSNPGQLKTGRPQTDGEDSAGERSGNPEIVKSRLLDRAAETAPELAELLRAYYRHVPAEEFVDDEPADLVGALRSHHRLAATRVAGRPLVQIFNPERTTDGWQSPATVVQIVTDDSPYLVDSVIAELGRDGAAVQRIIHPIIAVRRDVAGELLEVLPGADPAAPPADSLVESWMFVEVDQVTDPERLDALSHGLTDVLNDVREVVEDTERMHAAARALAGALEQNPPPLSAAEVSDGAGLLRWLADGHFTFLGYRHYELVQDGSEPALQAVLASGLGVLRGDSVAARSLATWPDAAGALSPELLVLTQASEPSTVHRPVHPFYVGVKTFDESGAVTGEHRFLGLFTTTALHENVLDIPFIERRVRDVIHSAGFPMESYSGQRMLEEIQNYPRAELFSTDSDTLQETITGVLALAERRKLKPFLRRDPYGRFYSVLVYLPRDRYTTSSRLAMQEVLLAELGGTSLEYSTRVGESALARVAFVVHTDPENQVEPDLGRIQRRLDEAIHTWDDRMVEEVDAEQSGSSRDGHVARSLSEAMSQLGQHYAASFPEAYKEDFTAAEGLADLRRLESLSGPDDLKMSFYAPRDSSGGQRRFKIYVGGRVTLSRVLPVLQSMGVEVVDERPYEISLDSADQQYWIYDFGLRLDAELLDRVDSSLLDTLRERFEEAFRATWLGAAEVDRFNALVLRAGLNWRQASVLRAYAKYLRQVGIAYSQDYIEDAILAHRTTTTTLVRLFEARFDPALEPAEREAREADLVDEVTKLIDEVTSLDADKILRSYLSLIRATLRTNFFSADPDRERPYLAFKLEPKEIPGLPEPRPQFEIFVYSPWVEGVHLRYGSVARGGLRWSDRREDFRTEILGLVKAQAVKNAVIVPVGAKGGFVVKRPPSPTGDPAADRKATLDEGIACYRMFISGLLDLTDNLVGGAVAPPQGVVRHDGDDTYLVVAADKGTATFSDIANDVAKSYGFWLGDAFASGGSVGYDHKAMGITAKGAWESVKRHFLELDLDTQSEDFTVVGIGDMAGDVFGNGMLLSEHIRLVAAFNHMHVFIDPDPDPAVSFAERRRLFELPRSTWDDYDRSKISAGGGVWSRSLKSIPLNPQIRQALGIDESVRQLAPAELIKKILLAPTDLLWNGGIGTYVKASGETHAEVGDKANDAVRVNGADLRVKVVGEGGNLGLTQLGRIEFARAGGKVNTDALDNSAGVDCSDHEVNIKILLDHLVAEGRLTGEQRNELLADMTDEVGELVLTDNHRQNAVLGISRSHAGPMVSVHARQVTALEKSAGLDRKLEALPTVKEFREREKNGEGLSSPELATLMAHVKLSLKRDVLASGLPDTEAFGSRLPEYFPKPLQERYADAITAHPLRREIITTLLVNEMVDGGGISFAYRLSEEISASTTDAVRAFAVVTNVYDLHSLWRQIDALGGSVPSSVADELVLESRRLLDRAARWMLNNRPQPLAIGAEIARFRPVVAELSSAVRGLLRGRAAEGASEMIDRWTAAGVPVELAERVGTLLDSFALLDIREVAELAERDAGVSAERSPRESADLYYTLAEHLDVERMLLAVNELERGNRWHSLARLALRDDFYASLRAITIDVLRTSDPGDDSEQKIAHWESANESRLARANSSLEQIKSSGRLDLATLSVAARQLRSMVR
ncbi:glutamate dehydrogenase (NAD) [Saccharopolyspora kobensis]|uniref:Glutamate dehydrogenase (NAD) n=1 Tax=Saccharopolyspora kobensis TaxID=146035 RepID=A0A1H6E554_9PSEU|nr:NAD-glutamate dehydrogenase [Saccharopolyspora kobensis]SEG92421.1 glutamate dehydrogenase (NAD) [Saccharopolyspora kobensis]SFD37594.1 glutamate dehydrogenase (NAD) [Saccharopolyspora kobensis]